LIFLLPSSAATLISGYGSTWGSIDVKVDPADDVAVLVGASKADRVKRSLNSQWLQRHYLSASSIRTGVGVWYRADRGLAQEGLERAARRGSLDTELEFRPRVRAWTFPPQSGAWWVITVAFGDEGEEWAAWEVSRSSAHWFPLTIVREDASLLHPLEGTWPLVSLAPKNVLLIGAGSIGSAAAVALASYGVRRLTIIDPQHLEPPNFARHQLNRPLAGRRKATALRDHLLERDRDLEIEARVLDVIDDADAIRPMLRETDIFLCATDGVASRRAMNHMGAWAQTEGVFACVLEDGAYGEVLRVRPGRTGCLQCDRDTLYDAGALDPEPALDRDYTLGGGARPMTAVGGDLTLVGQIAAKVSVSSLLERDGARSQALPGDVMTIALNPVPGLMKPFDLERCLAVEWRNLPLRRSSCPSCGMP
jgi:molybdopterin/thiamine biosynthesis adenylyltransferase